MRFTEHLRRQLAFLKRSADAYDAGYQDEAIRIATSIRVLLHDTNRCTSLLTHLSARDITLLSTCKDPQPIVNGSDPFYAGMRLRFFNGMAMFGNGGYRPKLGDGSTHVHLAVSDWWNQTVYILDPTTWLSRKSIVLAVSDKDGGAHVDERLTPEYETLITPGSLGVLIGEREGQRVEVPIADGHFLALRQMAYELLHSEDLVALAQ